MQGELDANKKNMSKSSIMKCDEPITTNNENACNQLQQFCNLAKTAKRSALLDIIRQALEAPKVYVFGELLIMPNVQELNNSENSEYYNTLNLFAYGTYKQYIQNPKDYITITPMMQTKLQHLTIVSLAIEKKHIPYEVLMDELKIHNIRELEDVIIDAIYADIIHGKLFQDKRQLEIEYAQGRDVPPDYLPKILDTLNNWKESCDVILSCFEKQIATANELKLSHINQEKDIEQQITNIRKLLKTQSNDNDDAMQVDSRKSSSNNAESRKKSGKIIRPSGKQFL